MAAFEDGVVCLPQIESDLIELCRITSRICTVKHPRAAFPSRMSHAGARATVKPHNSVEWQYAVFSFCAAATMCFGWRYLSFAQSLSGSD
jgi:hypothetical protein